MSKSKLLIDTPSTCGECPLCIFTADEKRHIGYCNTSDEDYYCKVLRRFMEYDKVDGGIDILGKPIDCPLQTESEEIDMADIELVIKIPKELKEGLDSKKKETAFNYMRVYNDTLCDALRNGTPLPKGHGDLKDFQKMYADISNSEELARQRVIDTPTNSPCYLRYVAQLNERTAFREMLFDAPTIVKADKEGKEWTLK